MKVSELIAELQKWPESDVQVRCDPRFEGHTRRLLSSTITGIIEVTGTAGSRIDSSDSAVVLVTRDNLFTRSTR